MKHKAGTKTSGVTIHIEGGLVERIVLSEDLDIAFKASGADIYIVDHDCEGFEEHMISTLADDETALINAPGYTVDQGDINDVARALDEKNSRDG